MNSNQIESKLIMKSCQVESKGQLSEHDIEAVGDPEDNSIKALEGTKLNGPLSRRKFFGVGGSAVALGLSTMLIQNRTKAALFTTRPFSPNGYARGECTWAVDGLCYQNGWLLGWYDSKGRNIGRQNAKDWYATLRGTQLVSPTVPGQVMVVGSYSGSSLGHVAFVSKIVNKTDFIVLHGHWSVGDVFATVEGNYIRQALMRFGPAGFVTPVYGPNWFGSRLPVLGFVRKG